MSMKIFSIANPAGRARPIAAGPRGLRCSVVLPAGRALPRLLATQQALTGRSSGVLVSTPPRRNTTATDNGSKAGSPVPLTRTYPWIDPAWAGLECVHNDPPVYLIHNLLSEAECNSLITGARNGVMAPLQYENSVLIDTHRLWPLALVVAAGAAFDVVRSDATTAAALWQAAAGATVIWGAGVSVMVGLVHAVMRRAIGDRVFTGTKWSVTSLFNSGGNSSGSSSNTDSSTCSDVPAATAARAAVRRFIDETAALLGTRSDHLEAPTVTRYQQGEQQRVHFDGRPAGDPRLGDFMASGGQRLVQVVTYLNTLQPEEGGGTRFHHPVLGNLTIKPQRGTALVFFPAFADGTLDGRMAHSGQPVVGGGGAEKWIINTWACQMPVPSSVDSKAAIS